MKKRVLLVQCCDIPQFCCVAQTLKELHPDWSVSALVYDLPQMPFYLPELSFFEVHFLSHEDLDLSQYQSLILPLLNQGYFAAKRRVWRSPVEKWGIDYDGNLRPLSALEIGFSLLRSRHRPGPQFVSFLQRFPLPKLKGEILLLETCHRYLVRLSESKVKEILPDETRVKRIRDGSMLENWKAVRHRRFDGALIFCSTEKGFLGLRLLPFLLRIRNLLIVNENGQLLTADKRGLLQFLYRRLAHGARFAHPSPRVLLWQTEGVEYTAAALKSLKGLHHFAGAKVLLVCGEKDRPRLETLGSFDETFPWKKSGGIAQIRRLRQRIKAFEPDFNCAVFTGRPIFRKQKIGFFLLGSRQKLAFNANLDSYWLTPGTLSRIFKKERLRFGLHGISRVLLLESSSRENMRSAAEIILQPKVVPGAEITLFCREDKEHLLEGLGLENRAITYSKDSAIHNLQSLWKLLRFRPDVLAAVFSGARIYPKHRLLFWLIPARRRLAFNRHLDCFYIDRRNIFNLFPEAPGLSASPFRKVLRGLLFLPRFLYLLCWWAAQRWGLVRDR